MKKAKNLVLLAVFAVCSFILTGAVVNAAATASVNNFQVVCTPDNVKNGETTKCYLVANITNADDGSGLHGVVTKNTFHNLTLVQTDSLITGVNAVDLKNAQSQTLPTVAGGAEVKYTCDNSTGCTIIYTNDATAKKIAKGSSAAISSTEFDASNYTAIAAYTVKLSEEATTAECGEFCVDVYYTTSAAGYVHDATAAEFLHQSGPIVCDEVKPSGKGKELPTGSFTSYVVLAAGAFIAVSAIVVAKKNNKFGRI